MNYKKDPPQIGDVVTVTNKPAGIITTVIRYDSGGKWCCGVKFPNSSTTVLNVYRDGETWSGIEYVPTRYPDEDGLIKNM